MRSQSYLLSSLHKLCLISTYFVAFLINLNESLVLKRDKRYTISQAVSGWMSPRDNTKSYSQIAFVLPKKSSVLLGSSSADSGASGKPESSTFFFADVSSDFSDNSIDNRADKELKNSQFVEEKDGDDRNTEVDEQEQSEFEIKGWRDDTFESIDNVIKPLSKIQDGVPTDRVKGAAIAATALTFLASKGVVASGAIGLSAAYISTSKSVAGDLMRTIGEMTWDATETASKLLDKLSITPSFGEVDKTIVNKYNTSKPIVTRSNVDEGELAFIEAEGDGNLVNILKQAESVIGEADNAIAKAEADQKEKVKQSIEEELKKLAEMDAISEQKRIADEMNLTDEIEEKARGANNEETTKGEKLEAEDGIEGTSESKKERTAKATKSDKDEELKGDDIIFDEDQILAAVELAQDMIEGKIVGVDDIINDSSTKAEWDAAGLLANELLQDIDASFDADIGDEKVEALGQAAKKAVAAFESEQEEADKALLDQKERWADSMIQEDAEEDVYDYDFKDMDDLFSATNLDEIARAARAAVEANISSARDIEKSISEEIIPENWSSLKVIELKEELKKRGLKTSGKKADLVSRLEQSDLELSDERNGNDDTTMPGYDMIELENAYIEEFGRQARAAVELFQATSDGFDEEPTEEMLAELESEMAINGEYFETSKPSMEISKMTVVQLKEECRNRGMRVGGRKAELIERLENAID